MIVFSNKPGQLGNMLFIYANLLAYGLEHQVRVANPAFYNYQSYFYGTQARPRAFARLLYRFSFFTARVADRLKISLPFLSATCLNWEQSLDLDQAGAFKTGLHFLQGWLYRAPCSTLKQDAEIRSFFAPAKPYALALDDFFKDRFNFGEELVIGVHIRRGDYKNFENGKYFYAIEDYSRIMKHTAALFPARKLHFLVCSNEKLTARDLSVDDAAVTMAINHELLDMYSLARCHYMIGPPSTYSMWASVYGQVPLYQIYDPAKEFTFGDFAVHSSF